MCTTSLCTTSLSWLQVPDPDLSHSTALVRLGKPFGIPNPTQLLLQPRVKCVPGCYSQQERVRGRVCSPAAPHKREKRGGERENRASREPLAKELCPIPPWGAPPTLLNLPGWGSPQVSTPALF